MVVLNKSCRVWGEVARRLERQTKKTARVAKMIAADVERDVTYRH